MGISSLIHVSLFFQLTLLLLYHIIWDMSCLWPLLLPPCGLLVFDHNCQEETTDGLVCLCVQCIANVFPVSSRCVIAVVVVVIV